MKLSRTPICLLLIATATLFGALAWSLSTRTSETSAQESSSPGDDDALRDVRITRVSGDLRFKRPIWVDTLPDGSGRLIVAEQHGVLHIVTLDGPDGPASTVALDLSAKVRRRGNEEGLIGVAFHPSFAKNRRLFLHYSTGGPVRGVVSEFAWKDDSVDPRSERVILEQNQPYGNHNGGSIDFGPDGSLYISFGDGGAANDPLGSGQDLSTWLGAILRIDVDGKRPYAVPADNPFVKRRGARSEIWAYGLRNVWRMAFDPITGELWAGDVGQNLYEEIDLIVRGGNYGWNAREGMHPFGRRSSRDSAASGDTTFIDPVVEHPRHEAASITGGAVYRGRRVPSLYGAYVYADYATGNVWAIRRQADGTYAQRRIARHSSITHFGTGPDGELLIASFDGQLHRFDPLDGEAPPDLPVLLSQTGYFKDLSEFEPADAFVRYSVNVPLWSDGARKERLILVPQGARVKIEKDGRYVFPAGTVFLKTFFRPGAAALDDAARLETRVIKLRQSGDGQQDWLAATYAWNATLTDAYRVDVPRQRAYTKKVRGREEAHTWTFPGQSDCRRCHLPQFGFILGFRTEQINRPRPKDAPGQLDRLIARKLFDGDVPSDRVPFKAWSAADKEAAARSYLDVQCAHCHQPNGPGNASIDLRASTALEATGLIDATPTQGDLGVPRALLIAPGQPRRSLRWLRMGRTDEKAMPNVAHSVPDAEALKQIGAWIRKIPKTNKPERPR